MAKRGVRARRSPFRAVAAIESLEGRLLLSAAYHLTFDDEFNTFDTANWKGTAGDHRSFGANDSGQIDSSTAFHTYGFEWDANEVHWYIDGVLTQTQINRVNMPMYTLINLAVGGYWPGNPDSTTPFPA